MSATPTPEQSPADSAPSPPMVLCITETPEERTRVAAMFDGVGVLVIADTPASASSFLSTLGEQPTGGPIQLGALTVDLTQYAATWADRPLDLTVHELRVLGSLARHPGRVWTYRQLHEEAWERSYFTGPAAVQSVVKRLRRKFRAAGVTLEVEAVRGLGFRMSAD